MKLPMFKQSLPTSIEDLMITAHHMDPKEFTTHYKDRIDIIKMDLRIGNGTIIFHKVNIEGNHTKSVTLVWEVGKLKDSSY